VTNLVTKTTQATKRSHVALLLKNETTQQVSLEIAPCVNIRSKAQVRPIFKKEKKKKKKKRQQ